MRLPFFFFSMKMVQSSLAAQLSALRPSASQAAHSDAGGLKQRPSLLFSPSEAADLDAEAIHSIGLSGLAELEKHDPSLRKSSCHAHFLITLFHSSAPRLPNLTQL